MRIHRRNESSEPTSRSAPSLSSRKDSHSKTARLTQSISSSFSSDHLNSASLRRRTIPLAPLNMLRPHRRGRSPTSSPQSSFHLRPSWPSARRSFSTSGPQEALVTLFKRDSVTDQSQKDDDTVQMSAAGQRVIPATFNLQPIPQMEETPGDDNISCPDFGQAGGHDGSFRQDGATLIKQVTDREASFYEAAEEGLWPKSLLPQYFGRIEGGAIKIENLTHGFKRPCVIDLKMGVQTVEDGESSLLKKMKMTALDVFTGSNRIGCRLEGLSMYRTLEDKFVKGTKAQAHTISANVRVKFKDVLTFFLTDESGVRTDVAQRFQNRIEEILEVFEKNQSYRFIGSSILLIYDNDNREPYMRWIRALRRLHEIAPNVRLSEDQISGLTRRTRCDVRMIDFAHTGHMPPGMERDEGYIRGLHSIRDALNEICKSRSKPIFSFDKAVVDVMEEQRAQRLAAPFSEDSEGGKRFTFSSVLNELTALSEAGSEADGDPGVGRSSAP